MLKKFYFMIVAFALGAILSLSFQACADDYDNEKSQVNTDGCNCNDNNKCHCGSQSGNDSGCNCSDNDKCHCENQGANGCNCIWDVHPLQYWERYDEDGQVNFRTDYSYDDIGRVTKQITLTYNKSISGERYLLCKQTCDYTYSPSGDTQYITTSTTNYKEDGSVLNSYICTDKLVLYKK